MKPKLFFLTLLTLILTLTSAVTYAEYTEEEVGEEAEQSADSESAPKAPPLPRIGHLNMERIQQQLLAQEAKENEVVWLDVSYPSPEGDTGSQSDPVKVLALQQKSHKAQKHGAVMILHDKEQHADWPQLIRPLRKLLPETGWFTLSVNLPMEKQYFESFPERVLPPKKYDELVVTDALRQLLMSRQPSAAGAGGTESEDKEDSAESEADDAEGSEELGQEADVSEEVEEKPVDIDLADPEEKEPIIPYEDRAVAHVEAGIDHLRQQGYQNLVIVSYRASSNTVLKYIQKTQGQYSDKGFALVMIDPVLESEYQTDIAKSFGEGFPAPVLEVIYDLEDESKVLASERGVAAAVAGIDRYMQVRLPAARDTLNNVIPRRVRFWIERYAPGMVMKGR